MNLISLLLFILLAVGGTLLLELKSYTSFLLTFYVFINLSIIYTGYLASFMGRFSSLEHWILVELLVSVILILALWILKNKLAFPQINFSGLKWRKSRFENTLIGLLGLVLVAIISLNLIIILFSAPNNSDALTYHLARVAYYLQHDSIKWFPANQWPQVVHPKNSAVTFSYIFLISNCNENLTQLPQFFAYIITILSVWGISVQLQLSKSTAWISALLSGLPICLILGATTNQNDLLITSFAGCAIYFILCYKNSLEYKYLILFSISVAIMTGYKASAIMIFPVLGFSVLFSFYQHGKPISWKDLGFFALFTFTSLIIFTLPTGFFENYLVYGNPIGPDKMRMEHNFEGLSFAQISYQGSKNVVRYLANFCCFDGFVNGPKIFYDANAIIWKGITYCLSNLWPDIYTYEYVRMPFGNLKRITSDEEKVYFGIIGFLLIWPVIFWGLFSIFRKHKDINWKEALFLSLACIIFWFSQSFFGQFDPWRGRMFGTMILFAAPLCGIWWDRYKTNFIIKIFFIFVILLSSWAAIWSILFRYESSWIVPNYTGKTLFNMNRMEQVMRDLPDVYRPFKKFDQLVPPHAKIESWLFGSYPEYVLFGEHLTRKIYTKEESIEGNIKSDYIIFVNKDFPTKKGDIILGEGYYLRKTH